MKYTNKELGFILYNNRSMKMVENFIKNDKINPFKLISIEDKFNMSKNKFNISEKMVEIPINEIDTSKDDIIIKKEDVIKLTEKFIKNSGKFNTNETNFIKRRNIPQNIIDKWGLLGLSNFNYDEMIIIGATVHPILSKILIDGIEEGGILFPLYENEKLVNCSIRKINSSKSLKYSLACPDIPVWMNYEDEDEIWIVEGLFDLFALDNIGLNVASCSSGMWTGLQLYKILENRPNKINIFTDNDGVGMRTSFILKDFFQSLRIECNIFKSDRAKDPAEHFFEKNGSINDIIEVTKYVDNIDDDSFNFIKHLKNRIY